MFQRAFSVSTREPAALLFVSGGGSPTGVFVAWCNVGTFVRLCFGVSCGIARARSSYAIMSVPVVAVVAMAWLWSCRGVAVVLWMSWRPWVWPWLWCPLSLCRRRVVATRRRILVFAMVLVVSVLSWFAI